jgi:hypothetical protein
MTMREELQKVLAELRQRAKANYEHDIDAIERVEKLITTAESAVMPSPEFLLTATRATAAPASDQGDEDSEVTLIDLVERVFKQFPDQSWNVNTLERQLRNAGFVFEAKNPKASLNTSLARLTERGAIRVSKRGGGRKPNLYRTVPAVNAETNGHVAAES